MSLPASPLKRFIRRNVMKAKVQAEVGRAGKQRGKQRSTQACLARVIDKIDKCFN
jgi:hypothetical protein